MGVSEIGGFPRLALATINGRSSQPGRTTLRPEDPKQGVFPVSGRVCAVVVTYNREAVLRESLVALLAQTRPPDVVLVVDNASTDGTREMLRADFPVVMVLALRENLGGAGGFHHGMKWAHRQGYDWLWVMDDDARPAADCLARLLAHARPGAVLLPVQQDSLGRQHGVCIWDGMAYDVVAEVLSGARPLTGAYLFPFAGPLLPKGLIDQIGLPNKEFFISFDDWEYALRMQQGSDGEVTVVPEAILFHDVGGPPKRVRALGRSSVRATIAPWKLYYGARNPVYTIIWGRRPLRELFVFVRIQLRWMLGDMLYERDRWRCVRMRLRGLLDGATGRLGKRV